ESGLIAYRTGVSDAQQLLWLDRAGKQVGQIGPKNLDSFLYPELSRDETKLGVGRTVQGNVDIWIFDLVRNSLRRFTTEPTYDTPPLFSPDNKQIAFRSNRESTNIYLRQVDGSGAEQALLPANANRSPLDWSSDGNFLLYWEVNANTDYDIW